MQVSSSVLHVPVIVMMVVVMVVVGTVAIILAMVINKVEILIDCSIVLDLVAKVVIDVFHKVGVPSSVDVYQMEDTNMVRIVTSLIST